MGFFGWLGGVVDDFVDWLGRAFMAFINALVEILESIWDSIIEPLIQGILGYVRVVSFIIFEQLDEVIIQIWDPNNRQKGSITRVLGKSRQMRKSSSQTLPPPVVFNASKN